MGIEMTELLDIWIRDFGGLTPLGWHLRLENPENWARVHFFNNYRVPRTKRHENIVRQMAKDIFDIAFDVSEPFALWTTQWSLKHFRASLNLEYVPRSEVWNREVLGLDECDPLTLFFASAVSPDQVHDVFEWFVDAAHDRIRFTIHSPTNRIAITPYDGGVDFAFSPSADTEELRNQLKLKIGINQNL